MQLQVRLQKKLCLGIVTQVSSLYTSQYFILLEAAKSQVNTHAARIIQSFYWFWQLRLTSAAKGFALQFVY